MELSYVKIFSPHQYIWLCKAYININFVTFTSSRKLGYLISSGFGFNCTILSYILELFVKRYCVI
jgi:hypothetical protein